MNGTNIAEETNDKRNTNKKWQRLKNPQQQKTNDMYYCKYITTLGSFFVVLIFSNLLNIHNVYIYSISCGAVRIKRIVLEVCR